jgi:hypothetical protein
MADQHSSKPDDATPGDDEVELEDLEPDGEKLVGGLPIPPPPGDRRHT